ncbi:MAG: type II toxin-antitoxin system prevent-host-death family antitoxin [Candidatus Korobacteraceae bacterium]
MHKAISAAYANRNFPRLLRNVRRGRSYVVTRHGKPVAKIVPLTENDAAAASAWTTLLARLRSQPVADIGRWTREELY